MIDMSNREQVTAKLKELQAKSLPKVTIESFSKTNKSFAEEIQKASEEEKQKIEEYLSSYYLDPDGRCMFTEQLPFLEWHIIHGVMVDHNTGLNWRAYHYMTINGENKRFETIMQNHPDCYSIANEEDDDDEI